ncbi:MAG: type ISP restriction/modification enzyme [Moraxellaceae bacterium]
MDKEADTLNSFYDSVKERAKGIDSAEGKQKIIVELYDKFFRNAFPKMTEKLGIVYTPVEVVDFILHSVNDVLQQEFGQTIGSKGVHVIDPFTGTGTFISRLIQSDLISDAELVHKYKHELHANEIVLLAYYIAAINIEASYHGRVIDEYTPFEGICLTDTFQMYEKDDLVSEVLVDNSARRTRQKSLDIRVIVGNPPYSIGQKSENDNNDNVSYPHLDSRIRKTYAEKSNATLSKGLYDSYIRAIRWASDRLGDQGIIGFVTNAGWIEANTADGLRKCLADEFSSLYIFHLRGNQRTSGERSRKEGGKIFGSGSRAPIAISLLVKNPNATEAGKIHFYDIGDYLSREEKLDKISEFSSVQAINDADLWQRITPDQHGDWLSQRDDDFSEIISLGDKKDKSSPAIFHNYSLGIATNRDAWCYQSSAKKMQEKLTGMIAFYNEELDRLTDSACDKKMIDSFIRNDKTKISWTDTLKKDLANNVRLSFIEKNLSKSIYRPFTKQWLYYNKNLNQRHYQMIKIFPTVNISNLIICTTGIGGKKGASCIISDKIVDLNSLEAGAQCFPLYLYEPTTQATATDDLFSRTDDGLDNSKVPQYTRRDAITDDGLAHFADYYASQTNGDTISKEDLFYYIYGLLHSEDYRTRYADNLSKELPRIPRVKSYADFKHFSDAGRQLAHYHLNYESVEAYPVSFNTNLDQLTDADFYVTKMKFGAGKDKTTVIYNHKITLSGIPLEAYDYVVNGKAALDWVMERQSVKIDKDSGIVNDANDWAIETMHNPRYPLELLQRVITVSLATLKIVRGLPPLDIE